MHLVGSPESQTEGSASVSVHQTLLILKTQLHATSSREPPWLLLPQSPERLQVCCHSHPPQASPALWSPSQPPGCQHSPADRGLSLSPHPVPRAAPLTAPSPCWVTASHSCLLDPEHQVGRGGALLGAESEARLRAQHTVGAWQVCAE